MELLQWKEIGPVKPPIGSTVKRRGIIGEVVGHCCDHSCSAIDVEAAGGSTDEVWPLDTTLEQLSYPLVGDIVWYESGLATVIGKRSRGGYLRLDLKLSDGRPITSCKTSYPSRIKHKFSNREAYFKSKFACQCGHSTSDHEGECKHCSCDRLVLDGLDDLGVPFSVVCECGHFNGDHNSLNDCAQVVNGASYEVCSCNKFKSAVKETHQEVHGVNYELCECGHDQGIHKGFGQPSCLNGHTTATGRTWGPPGETPCSCENFESVKKETPVNTISAATLEEPLLQEMEKHSVQEIEEILMSDKENFEKMEMVMSENTSGEEKKGFWDKLIGSPMEEIKRAAPLSAARAVTGFTKGFLVGLAQRFTEPTGWFWKNRKIKANEEMIKRIADHELSDAVISYLLGCVVGITPIPWASEEGRLAMASALRVYGIHVMVNSAHDSFLQEYQRKFFAFVAGHPELAKVIEIDPSRFDSDWVQSVKKSDPTVVEVAPSAHN